MLRLHIYIVPEGFCEVNIKEAGAKPGTMGHMGEYELTPGYQNRYYGNMNEPGGPEHLEPQESEENLSPTESLKKVVASNRSEGDEAPSSAKEDPRETAAEAAAKADKNLTREQLVNISRDIIGKTKPKDVRSDYDKLLGWGMILKKYLPVKEGEKINKEFLPIWNQIKSIENRMVSGDKSSVLSQREAIAEIAAKMKDYFQKERLVTSEDIYRQINSFEELMAKIADITEDDDYKPGGKFELIQLDEQEDAYGRKISKEISHPENFLRWMRQKIWFYHDFNPTDPISLFEQINIPTAFRTINLGEILYGGSEAYFTHRVPKVGDVIVSSEEIDHAISKGIARKGERERVEYLDPVTGNPSGAYVDLKHASQNPRTGEILYEVLLPDGKNVQGETRDKEDWNTVKDDRYEKIKTDVLYESWIMSKFHTYDVQYRLKGMASEKPLSEVMNEICGTNMMTQDRQRLLRLFRMQSTEKKDEAKKRLEGDPKEQGSVGKGMQRAIAGYYHLSEANEKASGYKIEGPNPFKEVMRGLSADGAQEFYKSLVNQTLEAEFSEEIAGIKELVDRINKAKIETKNEPFPPVKKEYGEALRDREDWEKIQLSEVAFLTRDELLHTLHTRCKMTEGEFNKIYEEIENKFKDGYNDSRGEHHGADSAKLDQLHAMGKRDVLFTEKFLLGRHGLTTEGKDGKYVNSFINDGFNSLDEFGVKFLVQPFDHDFAGFTQDTNIWQNISYDQRAAKRVRQAMRDAISQTEQLNEFEAKYAEEWAFTTTYFTGISARNDMLGIGHDAYSKIQNTEFYRLRQTSGGNYPGNLDNLYGIHRLGVNFWEGLKVQREKKKKDEEKEDDKKSNQLDLTLYEILTGLSKDQATGKYTFDVNKDVGDFDFHGNAMRQFYADHLSHAIELFIDITQKQEFNLDKLLKYDNFGRLTWSNEEMQKMIDGTWKHLRYAFDNRGFLYDNAMYGWWYDETIKYDKDTDTGQVSRKAHFGIKTLRELMFSENVRKMGMYERKDVSGWAKYQRNKEDKTIEEVKANQTKMGRNVFAYLIAAQLREHTRRSGGYRIYSAEEVDIITQAFMKYAARVMQGERGETVVLSGFFSPEEIAKILVSGNAILWILYLKEFKTAVEGGLFFGFFEALGMIMKQVGAGIKL